MSENILESSGDSNFSCTPPDVLQTAQNATLNLLPAKSRTVYEKNYNLFIEWCKLKKIKNYSEHVLLAYFLEKSEVLKSSSLWSLYSMLKSTLAVKNDIDISKFKKLIAFLKQKAVGYRPKKSKSFTREEINKFLTEAPDDQFLMMKVALILGVAGACRRDELVRMTIDDIEDNGSILIVKIPDSKTHLQRTFIVDDQNSMDLLAMYRRYVSIRPSHLSSRRLFINYKNGKCTAQVVGMNTIGKIPCTIAQYLNLPESNLFTSHCFRRSSTTLLANSGADIMTLKRHGGWRSSTVAEGYVDESLNNKLDIAHKILANKKTQCINVNENSEVNVNAKESNSTKKISSSGINIQNCQNCTFHFNVVNNKHENSG